MCEDSWAFPTLPLRLTGEDVHLWRLKLSQPGLDVVGLASTLSEEERMRASRFRFERDRSRFVVTRGVLRVLLGLYLNMNPSVVEFRCGSYGKPHVAERFGGEIGFNLAHSHEFAVYAFVCDRIVGVDLERIDDFQDVDSVAMELLSGREKEVFRRLSHLERLRFFFDWWTRKEAYGKAVGSGMAREFDLFQELHPRQGGTIRISSRNCGRASQLSGTSLSLAAAYVCALVVEGCDWRLHRFEFPPRMSQMRGQPVKSRHLFPPALGGQLS